MGTMENKLTNGTGFFLVRILLLLQHCLINLYIPVNNKYNNIIIHIYMNRTRLGLDTMHHRKFTQNKMVLLDIITNKCEVYSVLIFTWYLQSLDQLSTINLSASQFSDCFTENSMIFQTLNKKSSEIKRLIDNTGYLQCYQFEGLTRR